MAIETIAVLGAGQMGSGIAQIAAANGYKVIMWSKDTIDWRDKDEDLILKRATSDIQSGDLILMHPTDQTVNALPRIIDEIKSHGFHPVTVGEVLA